MADGRTITVPLAWYPRLLDATPAQRENWQPCGAGFGIHWPDIDEDLSRVGSAPRTILGRHDEAGGPHSGPYRVLIPVEH